MAGMRSIQIRPAEAGDVPALVPAFEAYMRETYRGRWHGSAESLRRDALGGRCTLEVALGPGDALLGFLGWMPSYDLHHCLPGAEVLDLYVTPGARGRGVALLLACGVAAAVERQGGRYLKGGAVETGTGRRLYDRIAACAPDGGCHLSGRAFRQLASLAHQPLRHVMRELPPPAWNHEA